MQGCLGCDVVDGKVVPPGGIIHADQWWVVDHAVGLEPGDPIPCKGFLIISPVRHVEHIHHLTDEEMSYFSPLLLDVTNALNKVLRPEKIHVSSFGETVKHVHWYVIPRMAGMPESGIEVLDGIFRRKLWTCPPEQAAETASRVAAELADLVASRGGPYSCY